MMDDLLICSCGHSICAHELAGCTASDDTARRCPCPIPADEIIDRRAADYAVEWQLPVTA